MRHAVAVGTAALGAGLVLVGTTLCATATYQGGWPDGRGFAGFVMLLGAPIALVTALATWALASLVGAGRWPVALGAWGAAVLAAVTIALPPFWLGVWDALGPPNVVLLPVLLVVAALVLAGPLTALQAWLWRRRRPDAAPPSP